MAKVFVVLRHDYESGCCHGHEFSSPTSVEGVFLDQGKAQGFVDKAYGNDDPSEATYGFEIEEHDCHN